MKKKAALALIITFSLIAAFWLHSTYFTERGVLLHNSQFTLYSLRPRADVNRDSPPLKETFHRYGVLGKLQITDPKLKAQLVNALYQGINAPDAEFNRASCFEPRHGIRAVRGNRTIDVVICFKCGEVDFSKDDDSHFTSTATSAAPLPVFDSVLKSAHIPLGHRSSL